MAYKFENAALFLRSDLLAILIHYKNSFFESALQNWKYFEKRRRPDNHMISLTEFSSTTYQK